MPVIKDVLPYQGRDFICDAITPGAREETKQNSKDTGYLYCLITGWCDDYNLNDAIIITPLKNPTSQPRRKLQCKGTETASYYDEPAIQRRRIKLLFPLLFSRTLQGHVVFLAVIIPPQQMKRRQSNALIQPRHVLRPREDC